MYHIPPAKWEVGSSVFNQSLIWELNTGARIWAKPHLQVLCGKTGTSGFSFNYPYLYYLTACLNLLKNKRQQIIWFEYPLNFTQQWRKTNVLQKSSKQTRTIIFNFIGPHAGLFAFCLIIKVYGNTFVSWNWSL